MCMQAAVSGNLKRLGASHADGALHGLIGASERHQFSAAVFGLILVEVHLQAAVTPPFLRRRAALHGGGLEVVRGVAAWALVHHRNDVIAFG